MRDPGNGLYKIGHSINVKERRISLNTARPDNLEIVEAFITPRPYSDEQLVHAFFAEFKINREWFDLEKDPKWKSRLKLFLSALR